MNRRESQPPRIDSGSSFTPVASRATALAPAQASEQLRPGLRDVACPDRQHDVSFLREVRDGIGQDQLQAWFARIAAKKAVLIFDTCESGSLASGRVSMASGQQVATRGLEQKAALGRLIQATGRATLTATTSTQDALEGYGGHGVFTFAILDALARGDTNNNGLIELVSLNTTWSETLTVSGGTLLNGPGAEIRVSAGTGGGRAINGPCRSSLTDPASPWPRRSP